jgi:MFS transporter, SP family, arabinose:H+ symporter
MPVLLFWDGLEKFGEMFDTGGLRFSGRSRSVEQEKTMSLPSERGSIWYVVAATMTAALGGLLFGFDTAVISGTTKLVAEQYIQDPNVPSAPDPQNPGKLVRPAREEFSEGVYVSSALLGCILGVACAGILSDRHGRKRVLLLSALLFFVSSIGCAAAGNFAVLVIFRVLAGTGIGVASMLSPMYISELSPPRYRGRLIALYQFAITVGLLGAFYSNVLVLEISKNAGVWGGLFGWTAGDQAWRGMLGACALPALLYGLMLLPIPESPRWLVKQNRTAQALAILTKVAGASTAQREVAEIQETLAGETGSIRQLFQPGWRIAILIGLLLPFFQQACGINAVLYYGPKIFELAGFHFEGALDAQVLLGVVNCVCTVIAIAMIDKVGRRPLLIVGVAGCVLSLLAVGILFHFEQSYSAEFLKNYYGRFLLAGVIAFLACFEFSLGPVSWVIISEIFPTRIRGRAMSMGTFMVWFTNFVLMLLLPLMLSWLTPAGTFWLFAVLCFPAIPLALFVIPETKGRTLEEIERYWLQKGAKHAS